MADYHKILTTYTVVLTAEEHSLLSLLIDNGWGDGDFIDLIEKNEVPIIESAMEKYRRAKKSTTTKK